VEESSRRHFAGYVHVKHWNFLYYCSNIAKSENAKPEVILTNFFAEPTVLLVPITSRVTCTYMYRWFIFKVSVYRALYLSIQTTNGNFLYYCSNIAKSENAMLWRMLSRLETCIVYCCIWTVTLAKSIVPRKTWRRFWHSYISKLFLTKMQVKFSIFFHRGSLNVIYQSPFPLSLESWHLLKVDRVFISFMFKSVNLSILQNTINKTSKSPHAFAMCSIRTDLKQENEKIDSHKHNSRFCKEIREDNFRFLWRRVHEDASQGMYMSKIEMFLFNGLE
jgi:hypothetical protein